MPCPALPSLALSCPVWPSLALPCLSLLCPALPYLALPFLALPCSILPCLVSLCQESINWQDLSLLSTQVYYGNFFWVHMNMITLPLINILTCWLLCISPSICHIFFYFCQKAMIKLCKIWMIQDLVNPFDLSFVTGISVGLCFSLFIYCCTWPALLLLKICKDVGRNTVLTCCVSQSKEGMHRLASKWRHHQSEEAVVLCLCVFTGLSYCDKCSGTVKLLIKDLFVCLVCKEWQLQTQHWWPDSLPALPHSLSLGLPCYFVI